MVPGDEYTSLVVEYFCSFGDHDLEHDRGAAGRADGQAPGRRPEVHHARRGDRRLHRPCAARVSRLRDRVRGAARTRSRTSSTRSRTCRSSAATARSGTTTPTTRSRPVCWPRRTSSASITISIRSTPRRSTTRSSALPSRSALPGIKHPIAPRGPGSGDPGDGRWLSWPSPSPCPKWRWVRWRRLARAACSTRRPRVAGGTAVLPGARLRLSGETGDQRFRFPTV